MPRSLGGNFAGVTERLEWGLNEKGFWSSHTLRLRKNARDPEYSFIQAMLIFFSEA